MVIDEIFYEEEKSLDPVQQLPPMVHIVTIIMLILLCAMVGVGIIGAFGYLQGMSLEEMMDNLSAESTSADRNFIRISVIINHLTMFVIPSFIFGFYAFRKNFLKGLFIHRSPMFYNVILGLALTFAAMPLAQFTFWLNQQLPLPDWMMTMEDSTNEMVTNLLMTDHPYEFFLNLLVIAMIPALGEELIFRGILQTNFQRIIQNPHVAIWLTAFVFSAFHLQFQGFIPRAVLGALLGYLFFWSGNLWVPIIAHFANNAIQVFMQYLYAEKISEIDLENMDTFSMPVTLIASLLVFGIGYITYHYNKNRQGSMA